MDKTLNADVIFLGADGEGKSTLLYLLKSNEIITAEYSKTGLNEEKIIYKNRQITIFDIEDQSENKYLWKHTMPKAKLILYIL